MNIIVSGWPGTGTSTFAMLLADLLGYRYLYAGGLFKYLAKKHCGATSGPRFVEFEESIGPYWDMLWEKYAKWKLANSDRLLLEGKTTGFMVESGDIFEIMLIATTEERMKRAGDDQREDPAATIKARDKELQTRWRRLLGVDIYSEREISANYDLTIDNTDMSIQEELQYVLPYLEEDYRFPSTDLSAAKAKVEALVADYWANGGKESVRRRLIERNLFISPEEILQEWEVALKEELRKLDLEVRKIFTLA